MCFLRVDLNQMRIIIRGIVQGVGFRPTVYRIANALGIRGYVQNNGSHVAIEVNKDGVKLIEELKKQLPPISRIESIEIIESLEQEEKLPLGFEIRASTEGHTGISIPVDTGVCDECLKEIFEKDNRRYLYPFTNCTVCGARFTVTTETPYDRVNTSMASFPMCKDCREEYENPKNRRFHHQTIACPVCGPQYFFVNEDKKFVYNNPIREFAERLHKGAIGVAKSWGGMHICCTLETLPRLREWYHRKEKPFAVMFKDLNAVKKLAEPTSLEEQLLTSRNRPIVLVKKKDVDINEIIAPGLGNIGAYLPYTGMHHILFSFLEEDALVMTSANAPGEPMILNDDDVFSLRADCYLLHNRQIINRCDDSVLRTFNDKIFFIRKSRGFIPTYISYPIKGTAIGLGAQENISGSLAFQDRVYQTQYIGDGNSFGTLEFLESAIEFQKRLLGVDRVEAIGIDKHPRYSTRKLGKDIANTIGAQIFEIQHHHAHAVSLLADAALDQIVALTLDGTGYGEDGNSWGGEVIFSTPSEYERLGHLEEIPLIGGDAAVRDPRRIVFALCELSNLESPFFNTKEIDILRKALKSAPRTTSFGRILDALSCFFGICSARTYEGEPAIKLERILEAGKREFDFHAERDGNIVKSVPLFKQLIISKGKANDRIFSFVYALLESLVEIAVEGAREYGVNKIGITGGVSYNYTISSLVKELVESKGFEFVCHNTIPNGDGGISAGQCIIASHKVRE